MQITFVLENINTPDSSESKLKAALEKYVPSSRLQGHENTQGDWVCTLDVKTSFMDNTLSCFLIKDSKVYLVNPENDQTLELFTYNAEERSVQKINLANVELFVSEMKEKKQREAQAAMIKPLSDEDREVAEILDETEKRKSEEERKQKELEDSLKVTALSKDEIVSLTNSPLAHVVRRSTPYTTAHGAQAPGTPRNGTPNRSLFPRSISGEAGSGIRFSHGVLEANTTNDFTSLLEPVINAIRSYEAKKTSFSLLGMYNYTPDIKKKTKENLVEVLKAMRDKTSIRQENLLTEQQKKLIINTGSRGGHLYEFIENGLKQHAQVDDILASYAGENRVKKFLSAVIDEQVLLPLEKPAFMHSNSQDSKD
jgi:hypothetical protein